MDKILTKDVKGGKEYILYTWDGHKKKLGRLIDGVFKTNRNKDIHRSRKHNSYGINWLLLTKYLTPDTAIIINENNGTQKKQIIHTVNEYLERGTKDSLGGYELQVFLNPLPLNPKDESDN